MLPLGSSCQLALAFLVAVLALAVVDSTSAAEDLPWLNVYPYSRAYRMSMVGGREGFGVRSAHTSIPPHCLPLVALNMPRECRPFCEA
jgi:hypothetical protein